MSTNSRNRQRTNTDDTKTKKDDNNYRRERKARRDVKEMYSLMLDVTDTNNQEKESNNNG